MSPVTLVCNNEVCSSNGLSFNLPVTLSFRSSLPPTNIIILPVSLLDLSIFGLTVTGSFFLSIFTTLLSGIVCDCFTGSVCDCPAMPITLYVFFT